MRNESAKHSFVFLAFTEIIIIVISQRSVTLMSGLCYGACLKRALFALVL